MDKAVARELSAPLEMSISKLSEAVLIAQKMLPAEDAASLKREVGMLIARISDKLLDPIYEQHPDLAPPGVL